MTVKTSGADIRTPGELINQGLPRSFDIAVSLIGLVITLPLLVISAAIITLTSPGGFLFRQKRVGRSGEYFTMYKLRTMRASSGGPQITMSADTRVTRVGRFLRKTKMDELPTLWNVLKGDMSLVGPRPEVPKYIDWNNEAWQIVLAARPGITDPVTLQLRNEEDLLASVDGDPEEYYLTELLPLKLKGNISYLRTRSWQVDLGVLGRTLMAVAIPAEAPPPTVNGNGVRERKLPRPFQTLMSRWGLVTLDLLVLVAAFGFSYLLRFDFAIPRKEWGPALVQVLLAVPLQLSALYATGVRKFIWRYIGLNELGAFAKAAWVSAVPLILLRITLPQSLSAGRVPISVIIVDTILALGGTVMLRLSRRVLYERYEKLQINTQAISGDKQSVLLIGAGRAGVLAAKEIRGRHDMDFDVKGFVDDAPEKQGMVIQGIKVKGTTHDLPRLVRDLSIDQVILTIAEAPDREIQRIVDLSKDYGIKLRIIPGLYEILDGRAVTRRTRDVRLRELTESGSVRVTKAASGVY
jgi:lipopolysaccharide/colanic/teichoic acid biosynthesis glycosyltransferase